MDRGAIRVGLYRWASGRSMARPARPFADVLDLRPIPSSAAGVAVCACLPLRRPCPADARGLWAWRLKSLPLARRWGSWCGATSPPAARRSGPRFPLLAARRASPGGSGTSGVRGSWSRCVRRWAATADRSPQLDGAARPDPPRPPGPPRPPPAPYRPAQALRAGRRPPRILRHPPGGGPVAVRPSAGYRTTRRSGSPSGCRARTTGMPRALPPASPPRSYADLYTNSSDPPERRPTRVGHPIDPTTREPAAAGRSPMRDRATSRAGRARRRADLPFRSRDRRGTPGACELRTERERLDDRAGDL